MKKAKPSSNIKNRFWAAVYLVKLAVLILAVVCIMLFIKRTHGG